MMRRRQSQDLFSFGGLAREAERRVASRIRLLVLALLAGSVPVIVLGLLAFTGVDHAQRLVSEGAMPVIRSAEDLTKTTHELENASLVLARVSDQGGLTDARLAQSALLKRADALLASLEHAHPAQDHLEHLRTEYRALRARGITIAGVHSQILWLADEREGKRLHALKALADLRDRALQWTSDPQTSPRFERAQLDNEWLRIEHAINVIFVQQTPLGVLEQEAKLRESLGRVHALDAALRQQGVDLHLDRHLLAFERMIGADTIPQATEQTDSAGEADSFGDLQRRHLALTARSDLLTAELRNNLIKLRDAVSAIRTEAAAQLTAQIAQARKATLTSAVLVLVAILAMTLLGLRLMHRALERHIVTPLASLTGTIKELESGDLTAQVPMLERGDEFGTMARALDMFKRKATEAKKLEIDKAITEHKLEHERELNNLQRQFVSMVSHEFRTPLAVIDGNAGAIERRFDRLGRAAVLEKAGRIRSSVLRLTRLMESVLSAARLEAGSISYRPESFDLRAMLEDLCRAQADISPAYDIQLAAEALPDAVEGDPQLLSQVFQNLIGNAVKYAPEGTAIKVEAALTGEMLTVCVCDRGVGIPADELPKLFSRFFRASTSTGIPGSGIGLHLVRSFVDMHGGRVEVESEVGRGTCFTVRIPASIAAQQAERDRAALFAA
ncbi:MAG: HAMP domain-containing histidine kinase [Neomegalonema sp.]|nr:HAMP domain-containing histidine kinase [Neomegalonema sp.]